MLQSSCGTDLTLAQIIAPLGGNINRLPCLLLPSGRRQKTERKLQTPDKPSKGFVTRFFPTRRTLVEGKSKSAWVAKHKVNWKSLMCPSINYLFCPFDLINWTASSSGGHDCLQTVICTKLFRYWNYGPHQQWFTGNDQVCNQQHVYFDVKSIRLTFLLFISFRYRWMQHRKSWLPSKCKMYKYRWTF